MSIERAPQPEDIIWDNCVYSRSRNMSIGIWLATIVINLASFSFIFGLLFLQKIFKKFNANINIYSEFVISIMIAMASVFINVLLRVCIEMTIDQQKHYTKSERAIALVNKIVIAQFLNAVIIPILSQYVIQRQTLHIQLSKMAFNYSIMNSFGLNLLLLFNYKFIVKYLLINTICIRNRIISYFSANQIHNDKKYIKGLNRFYEAEELDFSVSYAYCIGNLLHMSFFFFDQPVIIIFCLIGFMIYYSIQKFFLVTIYRTPDMISKVVFESMMDLLKYIPLAYAIGSFMSLRDIATLQSNLQSYVLHSLSIFVAVIGIFNPKNILNFIAHEVLFLLKNGKIQNSIKQHSENFFRYNKNYEEFINYFATSHDFNKNFSYQTIIHTFQRLNTINGNRISSYLKNGTLGLVQRQNIFINLKLNQQEFQMKNLYHTKENKKRMEIESRNQIFSEQFIEHIAKVAIKKYSYFNFKFQELTDEQCQEFHNSALFHREATRIDEHDLLNQKQKQQFYKKTNENKCPCCGIVQGQKLSITLPYEKFSSFGVGVLLYFYFLTTMVMLSSLYFLIFALSCLIINSRGLNSTKTTIYDANFFIKAVEAKFTFLKNSENEDVIFLESIIGFFWCLIFILLERIFRYFAIKKRKNFDNQLFTPSDLTIKIEKLPAEDYKKDQIVKFIEQSMNMPDFKVKKIFKAFKLNYFYDKLNFISASSIKIIKLKKKLDKGISKLSEQQIKQINQQKIQQKQYLQELLKQFRQQIKKFTDENQYRLSLTASCCLVRVNSEYMKDIFLQKYQTDTINSLERLWHNIAESCGFEVNKQYLQFKGNKLEITRAPEPQDMNWQNCAYQKTLSTKIKLWIISIIIFLADLTFLLMLTFLQYIIKRYNANITDNQMTIIQISISISTIILNNILYFTINLTIDLENCHSKTQQILAKSQKLIVSQCLNTILLPIICMRIIIGNDEIISLVSSQVISYSIVNAVVQNLLTVFSRDYIIKKTILNIKCIRNLIIKYYAHKQALYKRNFLQRLNQFYENQDIDISNSYAFLIVTFLHMSFFGFQEPIIILFGCVGIVVNCTLKRLLTIWRYKTPIMILSQLFDQMMKFFALSPLFFGLGGIYSLSQIKVDSKYSQDFTYYLKAKIMFVMCILIGIINSLKLEIIQKNIFAFENIIQMIYPFKSGQHDTGEDFDYYDDYHVNYNVKDIIGYTQYLLDVKPTDNTLQRINRLVMTGVKYEDSIQESSMEVQQAHINQNIVNNYSNDLKLKAIHRELPILKKIVSQQIQTKTSLPSSTEFKNFDLSHIKENPVSSNPAKIPQSKFLNNMVIIKQDKNSDIQQILSERRLY